MGYKNNFAFTSFGFNSSGAILKGLNSSETDAIKAIYKIQGNVVYPINNTFSLSIGPNMTYFDVKNDSSPNSHINYWPWFGGQAAVQADVGPVGISLGYQNVGLKADTNFSGSTFSQKTEETVSLSGFVTQVSYTF